MQAEEIIRFISTAKKQTPVRVYLRRKLTAPPLPELPGCMRFGAGDEILFGDWAQIGPALQAARDDIEALVVENWCRNSAIPLLDLLNLPARIEPGAIIREQVKIGENAVIMMGAVLNIGAEVGPCTMVDMNAVLGGRAVVGARCHIGAGAVLAGVIEPAHARPVVVEDDVLVGANAVLLEGVHVGRGAVVAAGSVVTRDVAAGCVAAGTPARIVKKKDARTGEKTEIVDDLRRL